MHTPTALLRSCEGTPQANVKRMRIPTLLMLAACAATAEAQAPTGSIVSFDMENSTFYNNDCPFADVGTNPNKLDHALKVIGIYSGLGIGDIVSVNGNPVKGTAYELFSAAFVGSPNPAPGIRLWTEHGQRSRHGISIS